MFGWGDWGRQRIFNARGKNISVTDGGWIIYLGGVGWVGYISTLGLLAWPVMRLFFKRKEVYDPINIGLALIICARLVDFIPNSGIGAVAWLSAGALLARLRAGETIEDAALEGATKAKPVLSYSRSSTSAPKYARDFDPGGAKRSQRGAEATQARRLDTSLHRRPDPVRNVRK